MTGCYKVPQLPPEVIPQVEAALVESRDVQLYTYATGYTEASHSVDIAARVEGFLQEIFFTEADVVEKGMPLFLIEQQNYQAQYNSKLANLEVLKAKVQLTEADLARAKILFERNAITEQEYQTSFAENEQAKASVKAGEAEVHIAKINLDYTTISSPIKGMINRTNVDIGNVVGPGSGHTILTTIKCLNPLYVYFDITDVQFNAMMNHLAQIHADGDQAGNSEPKTAPLLQTGEGRELVPFEMALAGDLTEKGLPAFHYRGMINYIDNTIGRDVGKITFRGEMSNFDYRIFPGQICSIRIPYADVKDALIIREAAILTDLSDKYVLVVDDNDLVSRRTVRFGELVDAEHRIVLSGLQAGEKYIVTGTQKAKIGKPVKYYTIAN
ncbi:MAG: efflux RND transporter periplasmic adaptor subunit [Planctomycetaceae bacterium]|nr:efflux RND transporter periplasmic adaptor subunit [Planctomycetaceae bacterium]